MNLLVNMLLESSTINQKMIYQRILWLNPAQDQVVTIACPADEHWTSLQSLSDLTDDVKNGHWKIASHDPFLITYDENHLSDEIIAQRERLWSILAPILTLPAEELFDTEKRAKQIAIVFQQGEIAKRLIYKYLRRFWEGGQTLQTLTPQMQKKGGKGKTRTAGEKKRGRPNISMIATGETHGINVTSELAEKLIAGAIDYFETLGGKSLYQAYKKTLEELFPTKYELSPTNVMTSVLPLPEQRVTFRQFQYWYHKSRRSVIATEARVGKRKHAITNRALLGRADAMASGPGMAFQIDATIGDVYLVSSIDRTKIIGRPVIYVIVDTFSRMVVGFYVGLEGPSWRGALLALENMVTDKGIFCEQLGIRGVTNKHWQTSHLPYGIIADGGELAGYDARQLTDTFGIQISTMPPYRPDWKAVVERRFRTINDRIIHWLPGAVRLNTRGERDYRLDASLTLNEFRKTLALLFINFNNTHVLKNYERDVDMIRDRVTLRPADLWNWGIQNRSGHLRYYSPEIVRAHLLTRDTVSITTQGIKCGDLYYRSAVLEQARWFEQARIFGRQERIASHDSMTTKEIYLHVQPSDNLELGAEKVITLNDVSLLPCPVIEHRGFETTSTREEVQLLHELERFEIQQTSETSLQAEIAIDAQINAVVQDAKAATKQARENSAPQSKRAIVQGIQENRQQERQLERQNVVPLATVPVSPAKQPDVSSKIIPMFSSKVKEALKKLTDDSDGDS